jgi:hypothetical protein
MENKNEIEAQGMLIHNNPFQQVSIGDTTIDWVASDGDPTDVNDASLSDDAYFDNIDQGVVLTPAADAKSGYLYWNRDYDYTRSILIAATTRAGGGDGADGITIFFGGDDVSSAGSNQGGISVFIDEYNSDVIKIFKSGSLLGSESYLALKTLDDNTYNNWEVVYEYKDSASIILHLKMNGNYVFRKNIATWTPNGTYIGISGFCGTSNNVHSVKAFQVKSANVWLATNKY